jgi:hypothetical protein
MKILGYILSFLNFFQSFSSPFFNFGEQATLKKTSTSNDNLFETEKDYYLLENSIVEILKINNPQDRWHALLFLINNDPHLMRIITDYKKTIESDSLNDEFIQTFPERLSKDIYQILQNPFLRHKVSLNLEPFKEVEQFVNTAKKPENGNLFTEEYEETIEQDSLLVVQSFKEKSWYYDAGTLEASVGGSEQKFLKIPVLPHGSCLYHALGIDPDAAFFQKFVQNILKIKDSKARWCTLLSLINNERENLLSVDLQSYKKAVKNNFEENLDSKKNFTQEFAQEIAKSLKNADSVDEKMKYTLNMADKNIQNTLEKTLDKKIETFILNKQSDRITFQHKDSFKIILYKNHWCPIFDEHAKIPLRYLKKETWNTLYDWKLRRHAALLLKDSPVE